VDNVHAISAADVVMNIAQLEVYHHQDLKKRNARIATLQLKQSCSTVDHECFHLYLQNVVSGKINL